MPNIKSAKKRVIVAQMNNERNVAAKSEIKTQLKKFSAAVASGNKEEAKAQLTNSVSAVDRGVSKGITHKNAAARRKSALYSAYNQMQ